MRVTVRRDGFVYAGLTVLALAAFAPLGPASAQGSAPPAAAANEPAPKQVTLTQKTIDQLLATQKGIHDAQAKAPKNQDPKAAQTQVDSIAKTNGFATSGDFADASFSVGMVLAGMDDGGNYVGTKAALQKQIDEVKGDKKMAANEKKETLDELNEALKSAESEKPMQANVDLVKANAAKLTESAQQDD